MDPIDLLDPANPTTPEPTPTPDPTDNVTIDKDELERLRMAARAFEASAPLLEEFQRTRNQPVPPPEPDPSTPDQDFWTSPTATTKKMIQDTVSPYARQMAEQLGTMVVNSFKGGKTTDRFFAGVMPYFEKKMSTMDKAWLGGLNPNSQQQVLNEAWLASKGTFLEESERKNPPKTPPPNLSGGGSGGGGGTSGGSGRKTLEQLDPMTYRMAVQRGWSQERMDTFAKEVQDDMENDR